MQKEQFSEWEWENGAMLTTYLFRYTSGVSERLDITHVKFLQDSVYQQSFRSLRFWLSCSQNKRWMFYWNTE